jgi:hypothetical protein
MFFYPKLSYPKPRILSCMPRISCNHIHLFWVILTGYSRYFTGNSRGAALVGPTGYCRAGVFEPISLGCGGEGFLSYPPTPIFLRSSLSLGAAAAAVNHLSSGRRCPLIGRPSSPAPSPMDQGTLP